MSTQPIDSLESRAAEQRTQLHERATELQAKVQSTREKLDIRNNVRQRFAGAASIAAVFGLLSGYAFAGMFTRK